MMMPGLTSLEEAWAMFAAALEAYYDALEVREHEGVDKGGRG